MKTKNKNGLIHTIQQYVKNRGLWNTIRFLANVYWEDYLNPSKINKYIDSRLSPSTGTIRRLWICFDVVISGILYGSSILDYFIFQYFNLNRRGRKTFATERISMKYGKKLNYSEDRDYLEDKSLFNEKFSSYINRDWLDLNVASIDEFKQFMFKHNEAIVKAVDGSQGKGIFLLKESEITDFSKTYQELKDLSCICEERVVQISEMREFNPSSVNTMRITTWYDVKTDDVKIMGACLRMGVSEAIVDNACAGGCFADIDLETGVICTPAITTSFNEYRIHPTSHKKILGFQIPLWDEVLDTVKEAARLLPSVPVIAFDVVINSERKVLLIEGNTYPSLWLHQIPAAQTFYHWKETLDIK